MNFKKTIAIVVSFALFTTIINPLFAKAQNPLTFTDLNPSDPLYRPHIERFLDHHLILGYTQNGIFTGNFGPTNPITRAEFSKLVTVSRLAEALKSRSLTHPLLKGSFSFKDLPLLTVEGILDDLLKSYYHCKKGACQSIGNRPFTDVAEKSETCFIEALGNVAGVGSVGAKVGASATGNNESSNTGNSSGNKGGETSISGKGPCEPWYGPYVYYAVSKGFVKGYGAESGSTRSFKPNENILRLHALKMILANNGNISPETDDRFQRLYNLSLSRKSYSPKCLIGSENLILEKNGKASQDAHYLLEYATLADRLDFFGNECQALKEKGIMTPSAIVSYLMQPMTRQDALRFMAIASSDPELSPNPSSDPTINTAEQNQKSLASTEGYYVPTYIASSGGEDKEKTIDDTPQNTSNTQSSTETKKETVASEFKKAGEVGANAGANSGTQALNKGSEVASSASGSGSKPLRKFENMTREEYDALSTEIKDAMFEAFVKEQEDYWKEQRNQERQKNQEIIRSLTKSSSTLLVAGGNNYNVFDDLYRSRYQIISQLSKSLQMWANLNDYLKDHTLEETKDWGIKGKGADSWEYTVVMRWYKDKKTRKEAIEKALEGFYQGGRGSEITHDWGMGLLGADLSKVKTPGTFEYRVVYDWFQQKRNSMSRFDLFVDRLKALEWFYSPGELVGMIFRLFEPEDMWNYAAPETERYQPYIGLGLNIESCKNDSKSYQCLKTKSNMEALVNTGSCSLDGNIDGCWNGTPELLRVSYPKKPINTKHVFAGLSQKYYPKTSWTYNNVSGWAGGGAKLDEHARTNIGDIGAALLSAIQSDEFKQEYEKDELDNEAIQKLLKSHYKKGLYDKYDLYANIDAYALMKMLNSKPSLLISEAFDIYYKTSNDYYNYRFSDYLKDELGMGFEDGAFARNQPKFTSFSKHIASFAFTSRVKDNLLNIAFTGEEGDYINDFSEDITQLFIDDLTCFGLNEQGVSTCLIGDVSNTIALKN